MSMKIKHFYFVDDCITERLRKREEFDTKEKNEKIIAPNTYVCIFFSLSYCVYYFILGAFISEGLELPLKLKYTQTN